MTQQAHDGGNGTAPPAGGGAGRDGTGRDGTGCDGAGRAATEAALVVVSIDGLCTLKSGIGSIVHWFFEAIDEIVASTAGLRHDRWSLHALSPRLDPASEDYSGEVAAEVAAACARHRGDVRWFEVDDNSSLKSVWSLDKVERWRTMCRNAAAQIRALAEGRSHVTVLAHGTMYATLRSHLASSPNVQMIYMTHTLGRVFLDANSANRTAYEDEGFALMRSAPQDKIGYVGTYYRDVLFTDYDRRDRDLVPFQNAVYVRSRRFAALADARAAADLGPVPTDKRLVFSWGRCVPQKGFDVVIPAFGEFLSRRTDAADWHLVLLAPQEVAASEYVASLHEQLDRLPPGSHTIIEQFDPLLPFKILAHRALEICVFASRFEAGPLTLIEALTFGHEDVRIVWHDIPPMRHLVREQPKTFGFAPLQAPEMADAMLRAADGGGIVKSSVIDFATSMSAGLEAALDWWDPHLRGGAA
ncbi:MAG TPA: glycosyltransferase [Actinocrinis sp.]|nr:glycosyltransferase [Actinocrinis sp.]